MSETGMFSPIGTEAPKGHTGFQIEIVWSDPTCEVFNSTRRDEQSHRLWVCLAED
jgi:hypothetical protein